jgi:hypothetical protein
MNLNEVLAELSNLGVKLWADGWAATHWCSQRETDVRST